MIRKLRTIASRLKYQLVLEQPERTSDGLGGYNVSWQELAVLWAEISGISGSESLFAKQKTNSGRFRITLRYRGDINTNMRLRDDATGVIYHIKTVIHSKPEKQLTELLADTLIPNQ